MTPPSDVIPFDLYARENALLAEAEPLLADAGSGPLADYLQRLVKQYRSTLRDNLQLTRHADRQQPNTLLDGHQPIRQGRHLHPRGEISTEPGCQEGRPQTHSGENQAQRKPR